MRKRTTLLIYPLFIMGVFLVFASSCEKDENDNPTNGKTTAVFNSHLIYGSMTDQDGNVYKTVTIGTQTWMAENLRTTIYNDGTVIPNETDNNEWGKLTDGAYCNYNNTANLDTIATYGCLYNWHAVNTGKLAPEGWHVPSDAEWTELTNYLKGESVAGDKLKELYNIHWNSSYAVATNETGFTALPGGHRGTNGIFNGIGSTGYWWSATGSDNLNAWLRLMNYNESNVKRDGSSYAIGLSVRCIKN